MLKSNILFNTTREFNPSPFPFLSFPLFLCLFSVCATASLPKLVSDICPLKKIKTSLFSAHLSFLCAIAKCVFSGKACCDSCSPRSLPLPHSGFKRMQRVCALCYDAFLLCMHCQIPTFLSPEVFLSYAIC